MMSRVEVAFTCWPGLPGNESSLRNRAKNCYSLHKLFDCPHSKGAGQVHEIDPVVDLLRGRSWRCFGPVSAHTADPDCPAGDRKQPSILAQNLAVELATVLPRPELGKERLYKAADGRYAYLSFDWGLAQISCD